MGFSKAFEWVNHRLLLANLRGYGIVPIVISWAINGISQGSVIGPILIVIYVNDQPDHLSADSLLYADDVKLIAP